MKPMPVLVTWVLPPISLAAGILAVYVPGFWSSFAVLAAVAAAGFLPWPSLQKILSLALLTAGASWGLAAAEGSDLLFIALVGVLVALLQEKKTPVGIKVLLGASILLISIPLAGFNNTFLFELGIQIGIYSALALGLNVVVGMAGLLDLGYAAFFAIGAYTWAIFASPQISQIFTGAQGLEGSWFYLFMVLAVGATALTGILIGLPALRLRGDYLAIVTLGLGEVVRVLANNLDHPVNITNGPQGITPVTRPPIGGFSDFFHALGFPLDQTTDYQLFFYFLVLGVIALIILINHNLKTSKFGRAWVAIREDEIAAKAMGIPMVKTKLIAFSTGAAFSGAMGVIFAAQRTFVSPETFTLLASITILGMVVLGGMGSIKGVILGAAALTILNLDLLKSFSEGLNSLRQGGFTLLGFNFAQIPSQLDPAKYERLVFGIILILMMIFRPEGLLPDRPEPPGGSPEPKSQEGQSREEKS